DEHQCRGLCEESDICKHPGKHYYDEENSFYFCDAKYQFCKCFVYVIQLPYRYTQLHDNKHENKILNQFSDDEEYAGYKLINQGKFYYKDLERHQHVDYYQNEKDCKSGQDIQLINKSGEHSIRIIYDSLASTDYSDKHKLLMVIADSDITGSDNDKTTSEIYEDLIELFNYLVLSLRYYKLYLAIGETGIPEERKGLKVDNCDK
ncbi:5462_t:CDS:2, partial [Funneliformis caledonium]